MANFVEKLTDSVPTWGVKLAYGEKTTVDGHELLPVAVVGFGFGGDDGSGDSTGNGGGGGYALPLGAYVEGANGLTFRPNTVVLAVLAVPLVSVIGLALARIVRASR